MADFATTAIVTPAQDPAPSLVTMGLYLRQGLSYVKEMKAQRTPSTPQGGGGSGGPRPTVGLIFPRGM